MEFSSEEISGAKAVLPDSTYFKFLVEPGKSLTKAGVFNALCGKLGLTKLARSTHLYTFSEPAAGSSLAERIEELKKYGKVFEVQEVLPMDKAAFKDVRRRYPASEVSARNIPLSSDELRSKLGVSSGEDAHIFGAKVELPFQSGNFLLVCRKV